MNCLRCGRPAEVRWAKCIIISSRERAERRVHGREMAFVALTEAAVLDCFAITGGCGYSRAGRVSRGEFIVDEDLFPYSELLELLLEDREQTEHDTRPDDQPGQ